MRAVCLALLVALGGLQCGGSPKASLEFVPPRAPTPGDTLLGSAPAGADLLLEVDLARLRENAVTGKLFAALAGPGDPAIDEGELLTVGNSLLICVYGVGDLAKQLVLVQANPGAELAGAAPVEDGLFAVGDPELVARAVALPGAGEATMLEDLDLLRIRAEAMPPEAEHAAVRAVAMLDFDARVAVAASVGMSEVPVSLALWGDVIDDLAVVARVTGESESSHGRLTEALLKLRDRVAKAPLIRSLGLGPPLSAARLSRSGATVQVVFVLSPGRLGVVTDRLLRKLQSANASSPDAATTDAATTNTAQPND